MGQLTTQWLRFLEINQGLLGLVLFATGWSFMAAGWRFQRLAITCIYVLTGGVAVLGLAHSETEQFFWAAVGAVGAGMAGFFLRSYASPVYAGIVAAGVAWAIMGTSRIPLAVTGLVMLICLIAGISAGMNNKREATIVLTSLAGATMLLSGLVAIISEFPYLAGQYRSLAETGFFYPFLFIVPSVCGVLLQLGAAKRFDAGEIKV